VDVKSLEHVFNFLGSHNLDFYACGDFNIHMENNTKAEIVRFNRLLSRLSLKEHINMPTRGNAQLDLIISNDLGNLHSQTELLARTDHLGVFIVRPLKKGRRPKLTLTYRNYRTVDWQKFANDVVNKMQWNDESSIDTDTIVTKLASDFINNHTQLFDIHAPLTKTSFRQTIQPKTLTDSTKKLKKLRNNLYLKYKRYPNIQSKDRLDIANKYLSRAINNDTRDAVQNEISAKGLWHVKRRYCNPIKTKVACDREELNEYFASISNVPSTLSLPVKPRLINVSSRFEFRVRIDCRIQKTEE
jgi:hypothetical protein